MTRSSIVGGHLQTPIDNWPQAAASYPNNTPWLFFHVENCTEAKQINNGLITILRHYVANQDPYLYAPDHEQAARDFFNTFIDGTFDQHKDNVNFICELNEYFGGESPEQLAQKIKWAQAAAKIWATEYRTRAGYLHIRLVLARTAVGNDIPLAVAQAAQDYDCALSYHGYTLVQNKKIWGEGGELSRARQNGIYQAERASMRGSGPYIVRLDSNKALSLDNEESPNWRWFAGRWTYMDAYYKANGINVPLWFNTEGIPIGYHIDGQGNIHLHPNDGWRHIDVCNADSDNYLHVCQWWAEKAYQWNKQNNNRFWGVQLFTSNRGDWQYFHTNEPELTKIGNWLTNWNPTPPPNNDRQKLLEAGQQSQLIWPIPNGALINAIGAGGRMVLGNEFDLILSDNVTYRCQYAYDPQTPNDRWVYKCPIGQWDQITIDHYIV